MLRGGKHRHIHSDFRDNADCGKGLDTRHRHNKTQLRKIFSAVARINDSKLSLHSWRLSMWERIMRSFQPVQHTFLRPQQRHTFIGCFHAFGAESGNIRDFLRWIF